jgi:hypothetical protein
MSEQAADVAGTIGATITCPCCGGWPLEPFEDTLDIDGNVVNIHICLVCSAIVNHSSVERIYAVPEGLREAQTECLGVAYPVSDRFREVLGKEVELYSATLDFFREHAIPNADPRKLISAEIGIGRGSLLRASAVRFERCYGIDLAFALLRETVKHLGLPENIVLLESITHVPEPVDVAFAWHSLEHVPRLHDLVADIRNSLKPGGWLFFQVPLYRPNYVVGSHYTFLNRRAVTVLAEIERYRVVGMWTDHETAFLTVLLQRPED